MPTYLELAKEPVWGEQFTPANMTAHLLAPLRAKYGLGPIAIGAAGDNNHLYGRHRSRDWCITSTFCTNKFYGTTDARDRRGNGSWYRGFDVGISGQTLWDACHRLDNEVRAGRLPQLAEWFGTFDGKTVVGWFEGRPSSSDSSHLWHLHVGVWTEFADDVATMQKLYATITGATPQPPKEPEVQHILVRQKDQTQVWLADGVLRWPVAPEQVEGVKQVHAAFFGALANGGNVYDQTTDITVWGVDVRTLQGGGGGIAGPVDLTDAAHQRIKADTFEAVQRAENE